MSPAKLHGQVKKMAPKTAALAEVIANHNVLLEEMRSQFKVVVELAITTRDKVTELSSKFDTLDARVARIELRLDALEFAVRKNSEDIAKNSEDIRKNSEDIRKNSEDIRKNSEDIRKNSEDIEAMRVELRQLRADFDRREERMRIDALEKRVDKLESIAREDA